MNRYSPIGGLVKQYAQADFETEKPYGWMDYALCREMPSDMFFPEEGQSGINNIIAEQAKAVCAMCPLATKTACLQYAIDLKLAHGIFGGLSHKERRKLRAGIAYKFFCKRCGAECEASGKSRQMYCSDNCRKRAANERRRQPGSCTDCGGPTSDVKYNHCARCSAKRSAAAMTRQAVA